MNYNQYKKQFQEFDKNRINNFKMYKWGWILPNGDFYGCNDSEHSIIPLFHFGLQGEEKEAENNGWVKISRYEPFIQFIKINNKQIKKVFDWGLHFKALYALKLFCKKLK